MAWTTNDPGPWRIHQPCGRDRRHATAAVLQPETAANDAFLWSLADLMTLLLIFFIMLYSSALRQPPAAATADGNETARMPITAADMDGVFPERADGMGILLVDGGAAQVRQADPPAAADAAPDVGPAAETLNRQLTAELADSFSQDFYVRWEDRQPVIVLGERITFNVGEAMLLDEARGTLARVARMIGRLGGCRVIVSGHTDDLPIRTRAFPSNWELSAARAASVAKSLTANGISPRYLIIQGQSEFKPLVANTSDANRRTNRRVEISLITGG